MTEVQLSYAEQNDVVSCHDLKTIAISMKLEDSQTQVDSTEKSEAGSLEDFHISAKLTRSGRFTILVLCIAFLIVGRFSVPDNEVKNVEDKIITALQFANDFINAAGNQFYRDFFQLLCSLLVDSVFIITFGYWVMYGKNGRLPVSLGLFYVIRALVQKVWFSPFPDGFYWESPGLPSLVVPYGRGSDFFFSGHSGFLVICACEWHKLKMPKVRNFVILTAIYTIAILLIYRIHYSIDVFTGVFFAEWCFGKVNLYKDGIESQCIGTVRKFLNIFRAKQTHIILVTPA